MSLMRFTRVFLTALLAAILVGCATQTIAEPPQSGPGQTGTADENELTFRITWKTYSGRGEAISRIVESYHNTNPKYHIQIADGDETLETIETQLASGETDVFVLPYRFTQYLGYHGKLEDLTDGLGSEKSQYFEKLWELGVVDDKLYGIPWMGHSMGLIYNKGLLQKAGVDPQAIHDPQSLAQACEKVVQNTDARGIGLVGADHNDISWMVNQFVYGFGGALVNADGTKVAVNSQQAKQAILFYRDVLGQYAQETWTEDTGVEVMEYFRKQEVAFEIQGLWGITDIWKNGNNFETGVIPLESIGLYPEVGPMMIALRPQMGADEKAAAIHFIQYLISTPAQEMIMDGEYSPEHDAYYPFRLPVRKYIANSLVFKKYPEFKMFLSGFGTPSIDVPVPLWQTVKDKHYAPGLHLVMEGKLSVDAFLQQVQVEGDKILSGGK